jgi:hypothetical protein
LEAFIAVEAEVLHDDDNDADLDKGVEQGLQVVLLPNRLEIE